MPVFLIYKYNTKLILISRYSTRCHLKRKFQNATIPVYLKTQIYFQHNGRFYVSYKQKSVDRNIAEFSKKRLTSITIPIAVLLAFFLKNIIPFCIIFCLFA